MADTAKQVVRLSDYPGLMVYTDEGTTPPGAAVEQTNVTALVIGQLQVRRGYKIVQFEES